MTDFSACAGGRGFLHSSILLFSPGVTPLPQPAFPSSHFLPAPHLPFSPVSIPGAGSRVHAQDLSLSVGCFLWIGVTSWSCGSLRLSLSIPPEPAPHLPPALGALGDHAREGSPSPPQCFSWSYPFLLEVDGSGCQQFKYMVRTERRKGVELLAWQVLMGPVKVVLIQRQLLLSVQSSCQELPSPLLFLSPVSLLFCSLVLKNVPWNVGTGLLYQNLSFRSRRSAGQPEKEERCHWVWSLALLDSVLNVMLADFKSN